jgi:hypothetical protein
MLDNSGQIQNFGNPKLNAFIVDQLANYGTLWSIFMRNAKPFERREEQYGIKHRNTGNGSYFGTALPTYSQPTPQVTTAQFRYTHSAAEHPFISVMLEAFANTDSEINYDEFNKDEAIVEMQQRFAQDIYTGDTNSWYCLDELISDTGTIGGLDRSTYDAAKAKINSSTGALTLGKMRDMWLTVSDNGDKEEVTEIIAKPTEWGYYCDLLTPTMRQNYENGYDFTPVNTMTPGKAKGGLVGAAGLRSVSYMGTNFLCDKFGIDGNIWFLNRNYLGWHGRTKVPKSYAGVLSYVNLGRPTTIEGQAQKPSDSHGVFFAPPNKLLEDKPAMIGRFFIIGQMEGTQFRRQGRLKAVTQPV